MSIKATCPICDSHTSAVRMAFERGDPCPYCHLPPRAPYVAAHLDLCSVGACVLGRSHPGDHECGCGQEWSL